MTVEQLVKVLGLNPKFFEDSTEMTGREVRPIPDEGDLNMKTLVYPVMAKLMPDGESTEDPILMSVQDIRWDAEKRQLVVIV